MSPGSGPVALLINWEDWPQDLRSAQGEKARKVGTTVWDSGQGKQGTCVQGHGVRTEVDCFNKDRSQLIQMSIVPFQVITSGEYRNIPPMLFVLKTPLQSCFGNSLWGLWQIVSIILNRRYICKSWSTIAGVENVCSNGGYFAEISGERHGE